MFLQLSVCPWGGMRGCSSGVCIVGRGGMHGCSGGACMVALGGMHGCSWGGVCGCSGGCAWLLQGGMHGFFDEIRSMSGWYASYWNAFLLDLIFPFSPGQMNLRNAFIWWCVYEMCFNITWTLVKCIHYIQLISSMLHYSVWRIIWTNKLNELHIFMLYW